jgi:uncharacterized protein
MPTCFQLKRTDNQFSFDLVDTSGELLLIGGEYEEKNAAEQAINDIRVGSLMSNQIGASKTSKGETFFFIKNSAGEIIGKSLLFSTAMAFDNALHKVKDNACVAEVSDLT